MEIKQLKFQLSQNIKIYLSPSLEICIYLKKFKVLIR